MRYLIGLALAVALAACGTRPAGPVTVSFAFLTATPAPTESGAAGAGVLADYERTGCFDGVQDRLTVFDDGRLEYRDRLGELKRGVATPEQLRDLEAKLRAADGVSAMPAPVPADGCSYAFRAALADGRQLAVTTSDGARHPQVIIDAVEALERLRQQTS